MSEKKIKKEVKKDAAPDLIKQVANVAFTVRKMKNWMEEKLGADLDGDGRVGGGPFKKVLIFLLAVGMASLCVAAENKTALAYWSSTTYIDADGNMYANGFIGSAEFTSVEVSGKVTMNGELEVNGSDVDFNQGLTNNIIRIDQTNPVGQVDVPWIQITDARTGGTANTAGEATLVITPSGTHAISVTAGISALQALECTTLNASGALTLKDASIAAADVALTEGQMLFGDGGTGVAAVVSGDVLIPKTGVAAIQNKAVQPDDMDIVNSYIVVGDAGATGVAVAVSGDVAMDNLGAFTIQDMAVVADNIALADDYILMGNAGGTSAAVQVSSDILIDNTGAATIQPVSVAESDIILTEGQMLFGDGGTGIAAVVSGDVLIPKTGVAVIQPLSVIAGDIVLTEAQILIGDGGTGTATTISGDISLLATGGATVTEINGIAVATVTVGAALGDSAVQPADVWGAPTATPSTNQLVNTVAIQAKNAAGGDLSEFRLIRVWTSETSMGAASTNNIETLVLSTGTAVDTVVAHADYRYVTATGGSAVATITGTTTGTNYVMLSDGSSISATAITFVP